MCRREDRHGPTLAEARSGRTLERVHRRPAKPLPPHGAQERTSGPSADRGWRGGVTLGTAWAALVASAGDNAVHEHHAIQLCVGLGSTLRFARATETEAAGAVVPSDVPHALLPVARSAILYVLPESRLGRRLVARYGREESTPLDADVAARLGSVIVRMAAGALEGEAESAVSEVLGLSATPGPDLDPRIGRAVDFLERDLERDVKLAELATIAGLSESRLAHLFRAHLGIAYRPYRRWRRIERAFRLLVEGADLTAAAHAAGFSDSAHLSRSVVRAFGVPPLVIKGLLAGEDDRIVQAPPRTGR